ncbi:MAG TPA: glycosyltransferase family protein [Flavisolibacter sp.]|jgi:uncharacterized protein (TIGR00661 family)|nr:glycosyltransferase family protein [Flavisolibacter sp.]
MKILYAIQGTGNGHVTTAREVLPILKEKADVDILISGTQVDIGLPYEIKYKFNGLCFVFGKKGGIDYLDTYKKTNLKRLFKEIKSLPINEYDLVISDFEPVSAWACYIKNKPCIGFSHQAAVISKNAPKADKNDLLGKAVLKYYAPSSFRYGFHYLPYDKNVHTPIIRKEIRKLEVKNEGHYTVYLPSFSDKRILKLLSCYPKIRWEVFSKHSSEVYQVDNVFVQPVSNDLFIKSMVAAEGVLCGAGFQTPAEVIFLKKKLMVIPMKGQYEQQCNAAALKLLGVPVIKNVKKKQYKKINDWLESDNRVAIDFPDETEYIIDELLNRHFRLEKEAHLPEENITSPSKFRNLILKKIFYQTGQ